MDLAAQYNNRDLVPDHPAIIAKWNEDAALYRASASWDCDVAYGARPRNRYDVFYPQGGFRAPLVVFIHGGYWRSLDKSAFSHMAAGANAHGLTVAVPTYSLCPETTVPDIIDEMRQCVLALHRRFPGPLIISGHSAGGHLAAAMAATDWLQFGVSPTLIKALFAISGLFDLRPLMATPINDDLRLTAQTAAIASPLLWPMPVRIPVDCWVGGDESNEFKRQSQSLTAAWAGLGLAVRHAEVPGRNHFNVPNDLAMAESVMTARLVDLAGR